MAYSTTELSWVLVIVVRQMMVPRAWVPNQTKAIENKQLAAGSRTERPPSSFFTFEAACEQPCKVPREDNEYKELFELKEQALKTLADGGLGGLGNQEGALNIPRKE